MVIIYLPRWLPTGINLPTHQHRTSSPYLPKQNADLCGISACKVYPLMILLPQAVSSYLTFSTSPLSRQLFSVALSVISTYFSALVEIPGSSPVQCSVLSRLSSPINRSDSSACSEGQIYFISFTCNYHLSRQLK